MIAPDKPIHFVGIGGVSMSGLARILLDQDQTVTGSDIAESAAVTELRARGATIAIGHAAEHIGAAQLVVISSAVRQNNPELVAAQTRQIPVWHRSQMLAFLMRRQRGIAVSGTHGKTTTTALVAGILEGLGLDPTVLIGGYCAAFGGNAKLGHGAYCVVEADESDGSLLNLPTTAAVVTNIEPEHLDHYGTEERLVDTFADFFSRLPADGAAAVCADSPLLMRAAAGLGSQALAYGLADTAAYRPDNIVLHHFSSEFTACKHGQSIGRVELGVPGLHNVVNSLGAIALLDHLGIDMAAAAPLFAQFRGTGRRFERIGEVDGILIIDDYAHHPTEVRETLRAARSGFLERQNGRPSGYNRIVAVFQPHRYSRTAHLGEEFGGAFGAADVVVVTDVYAAHEDPIPGVSGLNVAAAIRRAEPAKPVEYLPDIRDVPAALLKLVQRGDIVMTLGAGNVYQAARELHHQLQPNSR